MNVVSAIRRAFDVNPKSIPIDAREAATLEKCGIQEPTLRSYYVWRRSLMLFVVFSAVISAGLASYREFAEEGDRMELIEALANRFPLGQQHLVPGLEEAKSQLADQLTDDEEGEEEHAGSAEDALMSKTPAEPAHASEPGQTKFAQFTDAVQLFALYALPLAALAVVLLWTRFELTFRITLAAFGFAFLLPLVIALCPWSWWGYVEPVYSPQKEPLKYFQHLAEGMLEGAAYLVTLLPTVLSLVPGVQRACIRLKMLLPQSILPGWFLVVASPFYSLCLLVIFVAINQFDTHPLTFAGILLFLSAPLCYAVWADLFTKPISSENDYLRIRRVQKLVGALTGIAGLLIVTFLATRDFMGIRLLGFDYKSALVQPLDIVEFLLETLSRSMFMTVLWADLFMRMNLRVWQHAREFAGTAQADNYDGVMGEFERIRKSTDQLTNNVAVGVGQPVVAPLKAERETAMIDAQ